jgi:DNA invertase Pin-like site-specific DNA recombinase
MNQRVAIYHTYHSSPIGTERELRQAVESRGDAVVATYSNSPRRSGWKALLAGLDGIDQIVVQSAADLPGRKVGDLLAFLGRLRDHRVSLYVVVEGIDTANGGALGILDLIANYRRGKLSRAIRKGQARAVASGKRVGRPLIPETVRRRIIAALGQGHGIRATARKFNVSPASIIAIRRTMMLIDAEAA